MKSLENYTGNKKIPGVYQKIINHIPKHAVYMELFAGSAAIYSLLTVVAGTVILNDINPEVQQLLTKKFPGVTVTNDCTVRILQTNEAVHSKDTFIFLDPPYLHSTRPNRTELYEFEMTDDEHIQLLATVLQLNCNVMIIHPKCELYDTYLKDWNKVEVKIRYNQKLSIEYLYMNYKPTELQDYQFLGSDCWDRQRIKRKGERWVKKLLALPELEKQYIINKIKSL